MYNPFWGIDLNLISHFVLECRLINFSNLFNGRSNILFSFNLLSNLETGNMFLFFLAGFENEGIIVEKCFIFVLFDIVSKWNPSFHHFHPNFSLPPYYHNVFTKILSDWFSIPLCSANLLIKSCLGHSLLIPCSLSDTPILLFNANFSTCKLIID